MPSHVTQSVTLDLDPSSAAPYAPIARNPIFILSAALMMAGCFLISRALDIRPGHTAPLITLIAVLQVYELLLVGLGSFLIRSRRAPADGRLLLLLDLPFLFDATHLNAELAAADTSIALAVHAALFAMLILKLSLFAWAVGYRPARSSAFRLLLAALILSAIPFIMATGSLHSTTANPFLAYIASCAVAAAIILLADRRLLPPSSPITLVTATLLLSILVHLVSASWVNLNPLHVSYFAPLVLAFTLLIRPLLGSHLAEESIRALQALLPAVAVLLSVIYPEELIGRVGSGEGIFFFSPLRFTLLIAATCYLGLAYRYRRRIPLLPAGVALTLALLGHSAASIARRVEDALDWIASASSRLLPSTPLGWGVLCVIAAFLLILAGAARTLLKPIRHPHRLDVDTDA